MPGETELPGDRPGRQADGAQRRAHRPGLGGAGGSPDRLVGQGLRHPRGGRPPREETDAEGEGQHAAPAEPTPSPDQ